MEQREKRRGNREDREKTEKGKEIGHEKLRRKDPRKL